MADRQPPSNPANFEAVAEVAAWHDRPVFYVVTTQDSVVPPDVQRFAGGMKVTVTEIDASHDGFASSAEEVARRVIEDAAK